MFKIKRIILFLLISLIIIPAIFSQEEEEGDSTAFRRSYWFYSQRMSPTDSIPQDALENSILQRDNIRGGGYYLNNIWRNIGPAAYFDGKVCGRVSAVKYANNNIVYIGAANGGIWKLDNPSTNNGSNLWQNVTTPEIKSLSSGAIAIDPGNSMTVYYATGEGIYGFVYGYFGQGIFKSTNGGINWIQIYEGSGLPKSAIYFRLVIRPNHNEQLFAVSSKGLYRSSNSGLNWNVVPGTEGLNCNDIVFSNANDLVAFISGPSPINANIPGVGMQKTTDGGISFFPAGQTGFSPSGRTQISLFGSGDNMILYAVTDIGGDNIQVYKSVDGGNSFSLKLTKNSSAQLGYNLMIRVKPDNPNIVFVGATSLFRSTDGGENFCTIGGYSNPPDCSPSMHPDFHDIDFNPSNPNEIIVTNDGGTYISIDGGTVWHNMNNNTLSIAQIYRTSSSSSNGLAGMQDNCVQTFDEGQPSACVTGGGDGTTVLCSRFNFPVSFAQTGNDGKFFRCLVNIWGYVNYDFGQWDGSNDWVAPLTENPLISGTFYTARRQFISSGPILFHKTTNNGTNWNEGIINIPTINSSVSPQNIELSKSNPQIIYLATSGYTGPWYNQVFNRNLYKSTNGGASWNVLFNFNPQVPNRYITRIVTARADNPNDADEVYVTLSGFYQGSTEGHIFKSTDAGNNWLNVSGNLPNTPVNDIAVWYTGNNTKNLVAATDVGVYVSINNGITWQELASGFPLCPVMDLEYMEIPHRIRAATFGRGVWEINLEDDIYIREYVKFFSYPNKIENNIVVCPGGTLELINVGSNGMIVGNDIKITVEDGGTIIGKPGFYFTLQGSYTWQGIEVNGNATCQFDGCTFRATETPLVINGNPFVNYNSINISNCKFEDFNGRIEINSRGNVTISNCEWKNADNITPNSVYGILSNGADNVYITGNKINVTNGNPLQATGIAVIYGNNIVIQQNQINNMQIGIDVHNSSPFISKNTLTYIQQTMGTVGIGLDNAYAGTVEKNTITDYATGISLYYSSPLMYQNTILNNTSSSDALYACYNSNPRLRPTVTPNGTFWDAGQNTLQSLYLGNGINIYDYSLPEIDYGYNTINGINNYITGIVDPFAIGFHDYYVRCNTWDDPINPAKFTVTDAQIFYEPYGCLPPGGGSEYGDKQNKPIIFLEKDYVDPPQPVIINYGNGIYDTIRVVSQTRQLPADQQLYMLANENELLGNYNDAIVKYHQLIQNYHDSLYSRNALKRIMNCIDKSVLDTNAYNLLRAYCLSQAQINPADTAFNQIARELAKKCYVRVRDYPEAIINYEEVVNNSSDSMEVLNSELNIIQTYMIMQHHGDAPMFVGNLKYLKPLNLIDGYKKIIQRLYKLSGGQNKIIIPKEFKLAQNYPNPFNPFTTISYSLPQNTKVVIKIFDILGRLVKELVNENKTVGIYNVKFDGTDFASGVYFYRIEAGTFVDTKKMVLVK